MNRTSGESSHPASEVDRSEGKPPTDSTQNPEKGDVLRNREDYIPLKPPTKQEVASVYSAEWADLQTAYKQFQEIDRRYKNLGDQKEYEQGLDGMANARKHFFQTPEGMKLHEMGQARRQAYARLDDTKQQKELEAATAARGNAEEALNLAAPKELIWKQLYGDDDLPETRLAASGMELLEKEAQDTAQHEQDAQKALHATPEWQRAKQLDSFVLRAEKALAYLQKQAQLYTRQYAETQFIQQVRRALDGSASPRDIPKPDAAAFYRSKQAWEQSQQEFRAFQRRNNPGE